MKKSILRVIENYIVFEFDFARFWLRFGDPNGAHTRALKSDTFENLTKVIRKTLPGRLLGGSGGSGSILVGFG